MLNIIKSDLYRILRGKAIYIAGVLMFGMFVASLCSLSPGFVGMTTGSGALDAGEHIVLSKEDEEAYNKAESLKEERNILKKYPYELDKAVLGANSNLYYIFIVLVVIVLATDFSNHTIKNTLSSSVSRKTYYASKLTGGLLLCTIFILVNNFGIYYVNRLINGTAFSSSVGAIARITLYQLPMMYGIISLLVCISVIVRKTSVFNAITIPLLIIFQLFLMGAITLFKIKADIMQLEYQSILIKLAGSPTDAYIIKMLLLGIFYIVFFNALGYYFFKKAEIK